MSKRLQPTEVLDLKHYNLFAAMCGWWLALIGQGGASILIAGFWLIALIPILKGALSVLCIVAELEPVYREFRLRVVAANLPAAGLVYAGRVSDPKLAFACLVALCVSLVHWWEVWENIKIGEGGGNAGS